MNKPTLLCDRCEIANHCLLNYDGIPCRKNRTVEPTNYDLLISKSPEELAVSLAEVETGVDVKACNRDVYDHWLAWLKSPVEKEVGE